jgi:hypothetical protein
MVTVLLWTVAGAPLTLRLQVEKYRAVVSDLPATFNV